MTQSKFAILERLQEARVVAILRCVAPDKLPALVESLLAGGITALEITMNSADALEQIRVASKITGRRALVGAGTVLDEAATVAAITAGAEFVVAPNLNRSVILTGHRYGKPVVPGAMTPTEIAVAVEAGADIVKVFPAGVLGPSYFKEVKAPLDHVLLMATGGVTAGNAKEFLGAGADLIGVGNGLISKELIAAGLFKDVVRQVAQFVSGVRQAQIGDGGLCSVAVPPDQ